MGPASKAGFQDVDWNRNRRTLVLALSTHCPFCTESAPFLRRLTDGTHKTVKIVAVLPEPVSEAEAYLNGEGVRAGEVRQAPVSTVGVRGRRLCSSSMHGAS